MVKITSFYGALSTPNHRLHRTQNHKVFFFGSTARSLIFVCLNYLYQLVWTASISWLLTSISIHLLSSVSSYLHFSSCSLSLLDQAWFQTQSLCTTLNLITPSSALINSAPLNTSHRVPQQLDERVKRDGVILVLIGDSTNGNDDDAGTTAEHPVLKKKWKSQQTLLVSMINIEKGKRKRRRSREKGKKEETKRKERRTPSNCHPSTPPKFHPY